MEFFIILLLTLINGIFSMSEIALVSSRKFKLENSAKKGNKGAAKALELANSPSKFLSTVQIGITLIGILLGIYSGENITNDVQATIEKVEFLRPYSGTLSVAAVLVCITYLSIVLGELLPKRIGLTYPETISSLVARPMSLVSTLTAPFVWLLTKTNDILLKLLGIRSGMDGIVTEEEIKSIIQDSTESGEIQKIEQDIVERVFAMGDRKVGALMTHRSDLIWFDEKDDFETAKQKVAKEMHSVYPVADGELDNIKGIVFVRELFAHSEQAGFKISDFVRQPLYVPLTTSAYKLLENFKEQKTHYALALDEYGSVQGMITMDDIMDALLGDTREAQHEEYQIVPLSENQWSVDGQYPFFEFVRYFHLENVKDDNDEFNTIGGFLTNELHRIPSVGDKLDWQGLALEVTDMNNRRIDKIRISKLI
jgi:putative hemolysin